MVSVRVLTLARCLAGAPVADDFSIERRILDCPADGLIVAILYASVDPAMRTWISGEETCRKPVAIGEPMNDFDSGFPGAVRCLSRWHSEGRLTGAIDVLAGLENFAGALAGLFTGTNRGKRLRALNPELL